MQIWKSQRFYKLLMIECYRPWPSSVLSLVLGLVFQLLHLTLCSWTLHLAFISLNACHIQY